MNSNALMLQVPGSVLERGRQMAIMATVCESGMFFIGLSLLSCRTSTVEVKVGTARAALTTVLRMRSAGR